MPTFTLELWRILELYPEADPDNPTYANIGLDSYPIFDRDNDGQSAYRQLLNQKIVEHYHNREIGQETVSMWKFAMRRKMNEIMPLYNQLYKSERLVFDPFLTVNLKTVVAGETNVDANAQGESKTDTVNGGESRAVQSTTPQVMLGANKDYATSAADTVSKSTGGAEANESSSSNTKENTDTSSESTGYQGMPSDMLNGLRSTFINIDMMIIEELSELFMLIWNNGDQYTRLKGRYYS